MIRAPWLIPVLAMGSCAPDGDAQLAPAPNARIAPVAAPGSASAQAGAEDDGSYLERIDPLGGRWRVERLGGEDFTRFKGWIDFSAGGFLNHGAGCSGGHPAFYRLDGNRIAVVRREPVRTGKCGSGTAAERAAAASSERRLGGFLDQVAEWSKPDQRTLVLVRKDGSRALLKRPTEPHPEIAGRWLIESIGGAPLVTERRPPTVSIAMGSIGAHADCNSIGGEFTVPAPGRIVVTKQLVSTAIGCPPEDAAEDALMAKALASATAYRLRDGRLVFTGAPGMVLRRPPPPNRQLRGEYRACGNTLLGAYHEGPITLAVDEHRMRDNAGCAAAYTARGPELALRLDQAPACSRPVPPVVPGEPVAIGGPISMLALARPDAFGFDEQGRLVLRTIRGLLTMCRKGSPPPFGD